MPRIDPLYFVRREGLAVGTVRLAYHAVIAANEADAERSVLAVMLFDLESDPSEPETTCQTVIRAVVRD